MKNKVFLAAIIFFTLLGFYFRYIGIKENLSFWNDESHTALFVRAIAQNNTPTLENGLNTGFYQIALYYVTGLFVKIVGLSEFTMRLPSALIGTLLIPISGLLTKKILGKKQACVVMLLTALSQMQLAWSTQLRPYIWLSLFTLLITYLNYQYLKSKSIINRYGIGALILSLISLLFHGTGFINLGATFIFIGYKLILQKQYKYIIILVITGLLSLGILQLLTQSNVLVFLLKFDFSIDHYKLFFGRNYPWLLAGAFLGVLSLWRVNKTLCIVLSVTVFLIFSVAIFKISTQYVRYSFSGFVLLYILFAQGLVFAANSLQKFTKLPLPTFFYFASVLIFFLIFPIRKGKLLFSPQRYYSINTDIRENPLVDYKGAFEKIKKLKGTQKNFVVMDAWNDRIPWYMPGQTFVFLAPDTKPRFASLYGETVITNIKDFEAEKKRYKAGVVIVENWPSQTSDILKNHIGKTLKPQFTQNTVPYNNEPWDTWSISVFSWGI